MACFPSIRSLLAGNVGLNRFAFVTSTNFAASGLDIITQGQPSTWVLNIEPYLHIKISNQPKIPIRNVYVGRLISRHISRKFLFEFEFELVGVEEKLLGTSFVWRQRRHLGFGSRVGRSGRCKASLESPVGGEGFRGRSRRRSQSRSRRRSQSQSQMV